MKTPNEQLINEILSDRPTRIAEGPNRYVYAICDYLDWRAPSYLDTAAGGVRMRYLTASKELAAEVVDNLVNAAEQLGIPVIRTKIGVTYGIHSTDDFGQIVVPKYYPQYNDFEER